MKGWLFYLEISRFMNRVIRRASAALRPAG